MTKFLFNLLAAAGLVLAGPALAQASASNPGDSGEYEPGARALRGPVPQDPVDPYYVPARAPSAQNGGVQNGSVQTAPAYPQPAYPQPVYPQPAYSQPAYGQPLPVQPAPVQPEYLPLPAPAAPPVGTETPSADASQRASAAVGNGLAKHKVLQAAEGVFGRGAEGLAGLIETILQKQGEPTAYITGSEAGGAVVVGLRYGRGTLHHKAEGDRPVFWTGPTIGFDFGADANKVFVLVYNLAKGEQLFTRFPAAEGHAYMVGGLTAGYLRRGNIVLIPIRTGVGMRLGVNAGYMRFSSRNNWLPF